MSTLLTGVCFSAMPMRPCPSVHRKTQKYRRFPENPVVCGVFCVCQGCTGSVYSGCSVMKSHSGWDAVSWQRVRMSWYRVGVRIPARYLWIPWWLSPPAKTGKPVFLCIDLRHVILVFCPVRVPELDAVRGVQCIS